MRSPAHDGGTLREPELIDSAAELADYLRTLSVAQLKKIMQISDSLAQRTHELIADWSRAPERQSLAIDSFVGDIYSGLQAGGLTPADRDYAEEHLRILSGLYGILRPYDGICPYRLEMGFKLPGEKYGSLYDFWGEAIAGCLPDAGLIVNLAAAEYSRTVLPFVEPARVVAPKFLTVSEETGDPAFVVVHAKIARGAFAHWLITSRVTSTDRLPEFAEIGYRFDSRLSTPAEPVFVCEEFGGKGLSMRLTK